jgi:PHD/YefM family antitoxin component YafN of YafNO toxin-antitoxin module
LSRHLPWAILVTSYGFPEPLVTTKQAFHPEYITDANGHRKAVVLPIEEYESLIEDLADLAVVAERRGEPTLSHEAVMDELKRDGLLSD